MKEKELNLEKNDKIKYKEYHYFPFRRIDEIVIESTCETNDSSRNGKFGRIEGGDLTLLQT